MSDEQTAEQVHLGNRVVELPPDAATAVRGALTDLANSYGVALDQQRRQLLEQMGTPGWQAPAHVPPPPPPSGVEIPDPDLLFANKGVWAEQFARNLEHRLSRQQGEQQAFVAGAVTAVDQEMRRRDLQAQAQQLHDTTMEEMLDRRKLGDYRRLVQGIYDEQYQALQHLPIGVAIDQIGALAEQEIATIRGETRGEPPPASAAPSGPPALLRSARRAAAPGGPAAGIAAPKTLSDLIRQRQQALLGGTGRSAA